MDLAQRREAAKPPSLSIPCSANHENSAFLAKFFFLRVLRLLLFKFFGCGWPRCVIALRTAVPSVFLPPRNARNTEIRTYVVSSLHCNPSESRILEKILSPPFYVKNPKSGE